MRRVLVIGCSGSGKSTLARALGERLAIPHIELDALHWGPGWQARLAFADDVERATRSPVWIADGNYSAIRDLLWSRADTVVWLDLPRWQVEAQVVARSLRRWVTRAEPWQGCREPGPIAWLGPEHPIRWSWTHHARYRQTYAQRFAEPRWAALARIRLRDREAVRTFLESV